MCGIVGYLGEQPAASHILDGLRALEYRGYDSAGLAILGLSGIAVRRCAGRISDLTQLVADSPPDGTIGIGHTRWATHGAVTDANAHPHADAGGHVVIVHNGITDNVGDLRARLVASGHTFASATDTEVIAHLIGEARDRGAELPAAVGAAMKQLEGAHAIVALADDQPDMLVAARVGAAGGLVVGGNATGTFLASDLPAVVNHTRDVRVLESDDIVEIHSARTVFRTLDGGTVERSTITVPWHPTAAVKGGFRHFLAKEIHEQPDALDSTIRPRLTIDPVELNLEDFELPLPAHQIDRVVLPASGTTGYAAMIGARYLETIAQVPATAVIASEFAYGDAILSERTLVVAITQSGETADVLLAMHRAREQGAPIIGMVNVVGSEAARRADAALYMHAGPEISVASTKTFTSEIATLYLLACFVGRERGVLSEAAEQALLTDLAHVPSLVRSALRAEPQVEALARRYHQFDDFLYIGRGLQYPVALEGALKLKELSYIHAEGYAAGELKHGPIALVEPDTPVVAIATRGSVRDKTLNTVEQVRARDGRVILVASEGDQDAAALADHTIFVPDASELTAPILTVIPLQLFAYHVSVWRGCDVDQPRNLAKSVTVE